jgi:protein FAM50
MQEAVKNTEILIPFVFYDGTNIPAGTAKVKKGDHVWLFLDRCRKVGAELGVSNTSGASKGRKFNRREWARVSVDDLMLVKGEIIIPHVCPHLLLARFDISLTGNLALRVLLLYREPCPQLL